MKATLLKRLDALVGPPLTRLFFEPKGAEGPCSPRSVLLIRPGGIGDAVLLIPAIRSLAAAFPDCVIDILAEKRNAAAFQFCPVLHAVYRYDSPRQIRKALSIRYDLVIDTEQWYRLSALVAKLAGAPRSVGFATNERERLFTDPILYSEMEYEALSFYRLLAPVGIEPPREVAVPFLELPEPAAPEAERLLAPLSGQPFAAIFPGASLPRKEWGAERFREVAARLSSAGLKVVVVGGADTRAAAERVAYDGVALDLAGKGSLAVSAAILARAQVLVSGDSGLLHIAAGLGTPTVSIFGPSDPVKWTPRGVRHQVFSSSLPCAPCSLYGNVPACKVREPCLDATPAQVAAAALKLWEKFGTAKFQ